MLIVYRNKPKLKIDLSKEKIKRKSMEHYFFQVYDPINRILENCNFYGEEWKKVESIIEELKRNGYEIHNFKMYEIK